MSLLRFQCQYTLKFWKVQNCLIHYPYKIIFTTLKFLPLRIVSFDINKHISVLLDFKNDITASVYQYVFIQLAG